MAGYHGGSDSIIAGALLGVAVVMLVGWVFGRFVRRFREPPVIGEILAGIALGPSLLGLLPGDLTSHLFPMDARSAIAVVAQFGLLPFMFSMGMRLETKSLRRDRRLALAVSIPSIVIAFLGGVSLAAVLYENHNTVAGQTVGRTEFVLFIGVAMSITAFPVLARILSDLGLVGTRVGSIALASAAVDDVLAWCLLAFISAMATADDARSFISVWIFSLVYVVVMAYVVRPLLTRLLVSWTKQNELPIRGSMMIMAGLLLSAYVTTLIGIHPIFGAFAFGVIMPRRVPDDVERAAADWTALFRPIEQTGTLLLPVFFIVTGLGVDVTSLEWHAVFEMSAILAVACIGKFIGAMVPARLAGLSWNDARTLGLLMNTRGLTELIVLNVGLSLGVLDDQMYTMLVFMAIITTSMAGPLISRMTSEKRPMPELVLTR